ncbi:sulfotransferase [Paraglaciecola arctica]|uniref:sulfotransferase n=1 Tax=Paraglaciecola arctica TaxID=1128911 RepID=UPI001C0663F3|nr:sulfotransferase [Paraglaciecola arctica]MBU3005715.1 sulfotransferase [Paraglaciecola arctica]
MLKILKLKATSIFLKFLGVRDVEEKLISIIRDTEKASNKIVNARNPYFNHKVTNEISDRDDIVFVTSRFRSGSTLLWNLFRQTELCTSYYEPFNERRWFNPNFRGENVDQTHRGVDDYWSEYNEMEDLEKLYDEDWIKHRLLMDESSVDINMKSYIEQLVTRAPKRPILQFNRIDFRLPWVKQHFPNAKILHLYRHPRDQWLSFLTDEKKMNKDQIEKTYSDAFYLDLWCEDLYKHFPVLDKKITPHPYQRFYYIWKLSYLYGKKYADISISFEDLTTDTNNAIKEIMNTVNLENVPIKELCDIISPPKHNRWKTYADEQWFIEHENKCEQNLNLMFTHK